MRCTPTHDTHRVRPDCTQTDDTVHRSPHAAGCGAERGDRVEKTVMGKRAV